VASSSWPSWAVDDPTTTISGIGTHLLSGWAANDTARTHFASVPFVASPSPSFRFVCVPAALAGAGVGGDEWARGMLREGEIALLPGDGGLAAIDDVARALDAVSVAVVRGEPDAERQERTVIEYAQALPLVWVGASFSEAATRWAHDRGPMTLLVQTAGPLSDDERRRIDRFVATLGRQSE
jgi:hypothetical protein